MLYYAPKNRPSNFAVFLAIRRIFGFSDVRRPGGHPFFHRSSVGCEDLAPGGSRSHATSILSHMASILGHMASILNHMFSTLSHIISIIGPMGGIASMLC